MSNSCTLLHICESYITLISKKVQISKLHSLYPCAKNYSHINRRLIDNAFAIHYFWQSYEALKVYETQEQKKLMLDLFEAKK